MKFRYSKNLINEKEFAGVISELKSLQPETHFDEYFSSNLKSKLLVSSTVEKKKAVISPYRSIFASRIFYSLLGSALTVLISIPFVKNDSNISDKPLIFKLFQVKDSILNLEPKQQITDKGSNAFGKLDSIVSTSTLAQDFNLVTYKYEGEKTIISDSDITVFKRTKDSGLKATYLNSDQAKKTEPILASSTISDSHLISLANSFIRNHGIDISTYGMPVIIKKASTTDETYLESVSVLYPLLIGGNKVYATDGSLYGISATVDVSKDSIVSIDNLTSQIYESSLYKTETDFDKILNVATSTIASQISGRWDIFGSITIGTSTKALVQYWFLNEETGTNDELYVPSLIFPVKFENEFNNIPSIVVVPIVKDFIGKQSNNASVSDLSI